MTCTPEQLSTLRHMLGINMPFDKIPRPYRDYAAVVPGDPEFQQLAGAGLVERYREASSTSQYDYFRCTPAGRTAAMQSHRAIRVCKAQRVYRRFLQVSDAVAGLTFRQFLVEPAYADLRREA